MYQRVCEIPNIATLTDVGDNWSLLIIVVFVDISYLPAAFRSMPHKRSKRSVREQQRSQKQVELFEFSSVLWAAI
jgi:hypothetical protein